MRAKSDYMLRHVCSSVRMEKLGSHWTDIQEIWYLSIFRKSVDKTQVSLKSDKNNGYFIWRTLYIFFIIFRSILLRMRNVSDKVGEKVVIFFFTKVLQFMRYSGKIVLEPDRPQMAMQYGACAGMLMTKATHTLRICSSYFFSTGKMVTRTQHSVTLYVHCLSCFRFLLLLHSLSQIPGSHTLQKIVSDQHWRWRFTHSVRGNSSVSIHDSSLFRQEKQMQSSGWASSQQPKRLASCQTACLVLHINQRSSSSSSPAQAFFSHSAPEL